MRVRVLFFGRLKEIVGRAEDQLEMPDGSRVEDVFAQFGQRHPRLADLRSSVVASLNQELASWTAALKAEDEVAFLPPVSGGDLAAVAGDIFELVHEPVQSEPLIAHVKQPHDGAVVTFDGIVRSHSRGRPTLYLDYEAYEPMALEKMRAIGAAIHERYTVDRIAIVHRLGRLDIGETSVFIAISAAHRGIAFDACRFAIDTLKRSVPIWKKEHFADGAAWAEGEVAQPIPPSAASSKG